MPILLFAGVLRSHAKLIARVTGEMAARSQRDSVGLIRFMPASEPSWLAKMPEITLADKNAKVA
ncbi:hypothetical protein D3C72_2455900 [compost metagenome]